MLPLSLALAYVATLAWDAYRRFLARPQPPPLDVASLATRVQRLEAGAAFGGRK